MVQRLGYAPISEKIETVPTQPAPHGNLVQLNSHTIIWNLNTYYYYCIDLNLCLISPDEV
jgi:hypothetical protein